MEKDIKTVFNKNIPIITERRRTEIFTKILADQKYIRDARSKGISFEELEKQGFKFEHLQHN